jgi:homoserine kinase type II
MEIRPQSLRAWGIAPTQPLGRAVNGLNNDSYFVSAEAGEFVLRVYRNTADPARVRDEHDLLGRLRLEELPFAIPSPVRTDDGDTIAVLETEDGPRLAALFERIPGEPAALDVASARIAGRALAQLDAAFGRLDLTVRAPATLRDVHPLVPEPTDALDDLILSPTSSGDVRRTSSRDAVARIFERVDASHGPIATSLPRQIVHGDFAFPNVLVSDSRVTGMLDFEFAGADVRAADLAAALYVISVRATETERWRVLEAFASGYRRSLQLDPAEAAAVPDLMLRRSAVGLVHWIGRWRRGIAPIDDPLDRVARSTAFAAWLDVNAARVATLASADFKPKRRQR